MPLISLTNRIIRQNPAVRDTLAGYNGLVFAVRASGLQLRGRFTADGLLEACGRPADAVLVLRRSLIDAVFDGRRPGFGDIAVEGDLPLGFNLLAAFSGLRLSAADLRQILAEAAASPSAERAAAAVKQAAERFVVTGPWTKSPACAASWNGCRHVCAGGRKTGGKGRLKRNEKAV